VTGYALALWKIRWAGTFLFILFLCAFVPFQIIMIPLVVLVSSLGLYGTIWAVAIVHSILAMPLLTLIFRNYYKDVPQEIINAAIMDSGSFWRIFFEIILPMSANIMIVVLVITSFGAVQYNVDMAAALLTAIPPLVVYFALGKFFVQGITAGAIKG
jgi:glucose/mannose transport system permease protein